MCQCHNDSDLESDNEWFYALLVIHYATSLVGNWCI